MVWTRWGWLAHIALAGLIRTSGVQPGWPGLFLLVLFHSPEGHKATGDPGSESQCHLATFSWAKEITKVGQVQVVGK